MLEDESMADPTFASESRSRDAMTRKMAPLFFLVLRTHRQPIVLNIMMVSKSCLFVRKTPPVFRTRMNTFSDLFCTLVETTFILPFISEHTFFLRRYEPKLTCFLNRKQAGLLYRPSLLSKKKSSTS